MSSRQSRSKTKSVTENVDPSSNLKQDGRTTLGQRKTLIKDEDTLDIEDNVAVCMECKQVFTDEDDKLMQSDLCDGWVCLSCCNVSDEQYNLLNNEAIGKYFHWYCQKCHGSALEAVKIDKEIEEICEQCMGVLREEIQKVITDPSPIRYAQLREEIMELKDSITKHKSKMANRLDDAAQTSINETHAREERKNNLIVFNVFESSCPEPDQRKNDDMEAIRLARVKLIRCKRSPIQPHATGKKGGESTSKATPSNHCRHRGPAQDPKGST